MASDWPTERLGVNCTKIGSGATPKGGKDAYLPSGPFTLIRSQNVYNEGFNASGLAFISPDQAKLLDSVTVEANDILINITGDSVARVCLAPSWVLPARVNQHVAIIRTKPDRFDSHYLRYVLISPSQQERLHSLAAVGATRNALTKGMLESLELPRPPLHFQRACAGVLASLDDRIDLLRQTNITLEAIAQTLFKSWFVDFDPVRAKAEGREPEGMDTATAALFPASLKEWWFTFSEHRVQSLVDSKLLVVGDGYRAKNSELGSPGVAFLRAGDLLAGRISPTRDLLSEGALSAAKGKHAQPGDTVFTSKGTIGRFAFVPSLLDPVVYSPQVCFWRSVNHTRIAPEYLHFWMRSSLFSVQVDRVRGNAAIMDFVSLGDQKAMTLSLPNESIQRRFSEIVRPLLEKTANNRATSDSLSELRDTLLPRLISGKTRLPEAESLIKDAVA